MLRKFFSLPQLRSCPLRHTTSRQRGGALIEAGILFLPLCIILFGIIEYGFIFKNNLTLSSATRAGVRTASASPGTAADLFFETTKQAVIKSANAADFRPNDQLWIFRSNANGRPLGDPSCGGGNGSGNCVAYRYTAEGEWQPTAAGYTWDPTTAQTCMGLAPLDAVGIRLTLTHRSITKLLPMIDNMPLSDTSVMNFEPTTSTASGCS